ncbi:MAG: sodium:calcium symporter [Opitutales bacterium]|nr:sodium:calcium symporter [Opitutales bacterium]
MASKDNWSSSMGVILAVAGSAVGLGNFLKFPGQVAIHGGAAFMIAYVLSFILVGLPFAMMEWTVGRKIGSAYHSVPWTFYAFFRRPSAKFVAAISIVIPFVICSYYTYIEAWCLGYAANFAFGSLNFENTQQAAEFFGNFVGISENGAALGFSLKKVTIYFIIVFAINFGLIYLGISKGIEKFCKVAMPLLILLALILCVRVVTLSPRDTGRSDASISQGMGFMWNPTKVVLEEFNGGKWHEVKRLVGENQIRETKLEMQSAPSKFQNFRIREISLWMQLLNPSIWIAAVGQLFFSMSVGMGIIISYASYLKKKDDVVLSALTSASANEFCEVCLGGMITVPAAVAFMGLSGVVGACASLFDLGFNVLPLVFLKMPAGELFGFMFFILLFLAAVTSSISILQPSLAFFEEVLDISRNKAVVLLAVLMFFTSIFSMYYSKGLVALDTLDFWVGQTLIFIVATYEIIMFSWVYGAEKLVKDANGYSILKLPKSYSKIWRYYSPIILVTVFVAWFAKDVLGLFGGKLSYQITNLTTDINPVAVASVGLIIALAIIFGIMIFTSKSFKEEKL